MLYKEELDSSLINEVGMTLCQNNGNSQGSIQSGKPTPNGLSLVVRAQPAAGRTSDAGRPEETISNQFPAAFLF